MTGHRELRRRIEELESASKYGEDSAADLYLKMLKHESPHGGEYPGAAEAFMERCQLHALREKLHRRLREDRYDEGEHR